MSLTLTIGGSNFLPQYLSGSLSIRERLANATNEARFTILKKTAQSAPTEGAEIVFKDGTRTLFAGYVTHVTPTETGKGDLISYVVECNDYTYIFLNKVAQTSYDGQTLQYIVQDLLSQYVNAGYGITSTHVETGPTITTVSFNYITLRKCFEKLAQITGYNWYVDYAKDLHFTASTTELAPESFTDSSSNFQDVSISIDVSQLRNAVVVRGGREETSGTLVEEFLGDGVARTWILREKPKTMTSIEFDDGLGGGYVVKTFGVDPIDDDDGSHFYMENYEQKYVRVADATTTPTGSQKTRVTYHYEVPVLVKVTSSASILAMKAIEGGDGVHDFVINRPDVNSKDEARQIALNDITDNGNPMLTGKITTRTGLLTAGSYFHAGQLLTINMPTWGISTDTTYTVQEVGITLLDNSSTPEYTYTITFGGRLIGIREFLEALAGQQQVILDTEEIDTIQAFEEILTTSESITKNANARSVTDTMTTSDSMTRTNFTPPFKWADEYVVDSYSEANQDTTHDLTPATNVYRGMSFANTAASKISSCKLYLKKTLSPPGNMTVQLYAHTGSFGTSSQPANSSSPLATSDPIAASTLTTSLALTTFTFSGTAKVALVAGTKYCLVLAYTTGDNSNYVTVGEDGSSPAAGGNRCFSANGTTWSSDNLNDLIFYVYGQATPSMRWGEFEWG